MAVKYNVIFKGSLVDGADAQLVKTRLAKILKLSEKQLDRLFAAKSVIIKKGVDKEIGLKYQKAFSQAGAICELKKINQEFSLEPLEEKVEVARVKITCPQCGCEQETAGLCDSCRVNLKKNINAQKSTREKVSDFVDEHQESIKESLFESIKDWIKGNIYKAIIVLILLPLFGSRLVLSAVFFSEDKHLMYQTFKPQVTCADVRKVFISGGKTDQLIMSTAFYDEFTDDEVEVNLKKWNKIVCRSKYKIELGNIGSEVIDFTELEFNYGRFAKGSVTPPVFIDTAVQNISASSPREQDPEIIKNKNNLKVLNLYPGTMVTIRFTGWLDGPEGKVGWDDMLLSLDINEGKIDVGSPSSTSFVKLLTVFF